MGKYSISLDNFAEWQGEVNGVGIISNIPLEPYMPSDEIHVDLARVARAAKLGRLSLVLFERYSESDSFSAGIESVGEDGSAAATFSASATRAPRIDTTSISPGNPLLNKGAGSIRINFGHRDLDEANLRKAEPWAKHIDSSIREGLRACSDSQLHSRDKAYRYGSLCLGTAVVGGLAILNGQDTLNINSLAEFAAGASTGYNLSNSFLGRVHRSSPEHSLIPYVPIDRLSLVQAYTRTRKFVEAQ